MMKTFVSSMLIAAAVLQTACLEPQRFELDVNGPDGLLSFGLALTTNPTAATASAGLTLSATSASVTEGGANATYTIQLNGAPADDVTVSLSADATITTTPASLTFTPSDWSTPQTVTISAVDNTTRNKGGSSATISHTMNSTDTSFAGTTDSNVSVSIADNDKLIFVTGSINLGRLTLIPNNGIAGADAICNADASRPDTTAVWKAIIVGSYTAQTTRKACTTSNCTNPAENSDWVLTANTSYVRSDGQPLGTTNAAGIIVLPLQNSWRATSGGNENFWSGLLGDWRENTTNGTSPNCAATNGDWDTISGGFTGQTGRVSGGGSTGTSALEYQDYACNALAHLLCAEQ